MYKEKLIAGTVQFGIDYGINNSTGLLNDKDVVELLHHIRKETDCLDTAAAYGLAEDRIGLYHKEGESFNIITKFPKESVEDFEEYFGDVLRKLNTRKLQAVLFHSYQEYNRNRLKLKEFNKKYRGRFYDQIGVSVYTLEEMELVSSDDNIDIVQCPFNLLDNNSKRGQGFKTLKENGKEIHVRSVFLQGLFFKNQSLINGSILKLVPYLEKLHQISFESNIVIGRLALLYVLQNPYVDKVLIGVDNKTQFDLNINWINSEKLSEEVIDTINKINVREEELLLPFNWK